MESMPVDKVRSPHKDGTFWLPSLSLSLCLAAAWCSVSRDSEWRRLKTPVNLLCKPCLTPFSLRYLFTESESKVSIAVKTICFNYEMTNIRLSLSCLATQVCYVAAGPCQAFYCFSYAYFYSFLSECSSYLSCAVHNVGERLILHWYKVA